MDEWDENSVCQRRSVFSIEVEGRKDCVIDGSCRGCVILLMLLRLGRTELSGQ